MEWDWSRSWFIAGALQMVLKFDQSVSDSHHEASRLSQAPLCALTAS